MTAPFGGKTVVLVVEDESLLRLDAVETLAQHGFQVLEAANADAAITILESRMDIDIIFTDIDMPGSMDGLKLAQAVRGRWPPIKILATSGHYTLGDNDLPSGGRFIPKPYTFTQIVETIRVLTGH